MSRRVLLRAEYRSHGRVVVVVEVLKRGLPQVTTKVGRDRVDGADRERAADWLKEYLPGLTHDERYAMLWS